MSTTDLVINTNYKMEKQYKTGYGNTERTVTVMEFTDSSKNQCNHFVSGNKEYHTEDGQPVFEFVNGMLPQFARIGDFIVRDPSAPIDFQFTAWKPEEFHKRFTPLPA